VPFKYAEFKDPAASEKEVFYAEKPVAYTCKAGYTLDATPQGEAAYNVACTTEGTFEDVGKEPCKPVVCGKAPFPNFTQSLFEEGKEFIFGEKPGYKCSSGYTLDGLANGEKEFQALCSHDGSFVDLQTCMPVKCLVPMDRDLVSPTAFGPNAIFNDVHAMNFVYPQELDVTCMTGYEQKNTPPSNMYTVQCSAEGSYSLPSKECEPIDCGPHPHVQNAEVTGSTFYTAKLTATAYEGYSLDGTTTEDMNAFTFQCLATGGYSKVKEFERIGCGEAPTVDHAENSELIEQITCTCSTPGQGTAGSNEYKCSDDSSGYCAENEECFATEPFTKGHWSDGCQIPPAPCGPGEGVGKLDVSKSKCTGDKDFCTGGPMFYEGIGVTPEGQSIDLEVTVGGGHECSPSGTNGIKGYFGKINLIEGGEGEVTFTFKSGGSPYTLSELNVAWFDIDSHSNCKVQEVIEVSGFDEAHYPQSPVYDIEEGDGTAKLTSHKCVKIPTASDPMQLTPEMLSATVSFHYIEVSSITMKFSNPSTQSSNTGGRGYMFAFHSALSPCNMR
jgi:hypothetical protein